MREERGKVKIVAKTGGIQLEGVDKWHNPNSEIKDDIIQQITKGDKIILKYDEKDNGRFCEILLDLEAPEEPDSSTKSNDDYADIKGKKHPLYKFLLREAHEAGLAEILIVEQVIDFERKTAWCKVRVNSKKGTFEGVGMSSPENTPSHTAKHYVEMANTRAKSRAFRDMLNIGEASKEEMHEQK